MLADAKQQIATLPRPVQLWMRWLNIVFLLGLFFVSRHDGARWALVAYAAAFPVGALVFHVTREIRLTGVPHILFWTPLLPCLAHAAATDPYVRFGSLYAVWALLLGLTIAVSVAFDIREVWAFLNRRRGA
jgi:hypothetical protein